MRRIVFIGIVVFGVGFPAALQAIVGEEVVRETPIVLDGEVLAIDQVGETIVVGGSFTQVQTERGGLVVEQPGLFAYDAATGEFKDDFRPIFSNNDRTLEITDIEPAPDGRSVFVAGDFLRIEDGTDETVQFRSRLAKIDITTGVVDRTFSLGAPSAKPRSLVYSDGWLYVGGSFLSIRDQSTGPAIDHPVRGLARLDGDTAAFDPGFDYRTENDIGPIFATEREFGVVGMDVTPDGTALVVAHRGAQIRDVVRGSTTNAGGVAIIDLGEDPATHSVSGFAALYPDPNDPIQEFYHAEQCGGMGPQIQDIETSPDSSYFIVVGQGADAGFQCDSATRFEITGHPVRPTWVARGFDSLFSVAVGEDAIYIGGHQRFMVHPDAPSPYPGATNANGEMVEFGEHYFADPTVNSPAAEAFRDDLFIPGFVYPVGQLGALDPDTGYGIPEWTPQSNALVGVLELTLTDRGLLLGQDNNRVNNIETGRAAVLVGTLEPITPPEPEPPAPAPEPPAPEPEPVPEPEPPITICPAPTNALADTNLIIWNADIDWYRVSVRRDGRWIATVNAQVALDENLSAPSLAHAARVLLTPEHVDDDCQTPTIEDGRLLLDRR